MTNCIAPHITFVSVVPDGRSTRVAAALAEQGITDVTVVRVQPAPGVLTIHERRVTALDAPACTGAPDLCGVPAGQPCEPGCPSLAADQT